MHLLVNDLIDEREQVLDYVLDEIGGAALTEEGHDATSRDSDDDPPFLSLEHDVPERAVLEVLVVHVGIGEAASCEAELRYARKVDLVEPDERRRFRVGFVENLEGFMGDFDFDDLSDLVVEGFSQGVRNRVRQQFLHATRHRRR